MKTWEIKHRITPDLSEQGKKEAQAIMDYFKEKIKDVVDDLLGELYCDVAVYIESDSWSNFRNKLLDGLVYYENRKDHTDYDFKSIRQGIYRENREEIIKDLNQDMVDEIEDLKKQVKHWKEMARSNY